VAERSRLETPPVPSRGKKGRSCKLATLMAVWTGVKQRENWKKLLASLDSRYLLLSPIFEVT
jgi:hypothetical protein